VITQIDGQSIQGPKDYASAIAKFAAGEIIRLKVIRGGRVVFVAFER